VGWHSIAEEVGKVRTDEFVLTEGYDLTSAVAFYLQVPGQVYCAVLGDGRRMNQYDVWGGFKQLRGRNAIVVLKSGSSTGALTPHFKVLRSLESGFEVKFAGETVRRYDLYRAEGYDGTEP